MRIMAALGGNALIQRDQQIDAKTQMENIKIAAAALSPLARDHELIITHGNGPQVGLLALQASAYSLVPAFPLDVLDAESEGMIGYMIEQALTNELRDERNIATLLTQVEVDPTDVAFTSPTKPIGPRYTEKEAERLCRDRGWQCTQTQAGFRRVVPSPKPKKILESDVIKLLVDHGITVICNGGGGIPVVKRQDGTCFGVEAVIDKDRSSALLAEQLNVDALLLLTDVEGVWLDWRTDTARVIKRAHPDLLANHAFEEGSMGPKIEAASQFARTNKGFAVIGALGDAYKMVMGDAGTRISCESKSMELSAEIKKPS